MYDASESKTPRLTTLLGAAGDTANDCGQRMVPPEGTLGYCTCAQAAGSMKRRKKCGSSVANKTIGTFLS